MMTTNLFVIANVKQLRTYVVLEFYCLFFRTSWGVGVLNSAVFKSFHNRLSLAQFWRAFGISGGGLIPQPPSVRHWWQLLKMGVKCGFFTLRGKQNWMCPRAKGWDKNMYLLLIEKMVISLLTWRRASLLLQNQNIHCRVVKSSLLDSFCLLV
jgi:hypothetical protein